MIRIAITAEAYLAICATLPLGSVMFEPEVDAKGERQIWLERHALDRLDALRQPERATMRDHSPHGEDRGLAPRPTAAREGIGRDR
jgi:hypothetical protein